MLLLSLKFLNLAKPCTGLALFGMLWDRAVGLIDFFSDVAESCNNLRRTHTQQQQSSHSILREYSTCIVVMISVEGSVEE